MGGNANAHYELIYSGTGKPRTKAKNECGWSGVLAAKFATSTLSRTVGPTQKRWWVQTNLVGCSPVKQTPLNCRGPWSPVVLLKQRGKGVLHGGAAPYLLATCWVQCRKTGSFALVLKGGGSGTSSGLIIPKKKKKANFWDQRQGGGRQGFCPTKKGGRPEGPDRSNTATCIPTSPHGGGAAPPGKNGWLASGDAHRAVKHGTQKKKTATRQSNAVLYHEKGKKKDLGNGGTPSKKPRRTIYPEYKRGTRGKLAPAGVDIGLA